MIIQHCSKRQKAYRAGAEGKDKTEHLMRAAYSVLEDLLFIKEGDAAI